MDKINETLEAPKVAQDFDNIKDKRKFLARISKHLKMLVKEGVYDSVNQALLEFYAEDLPEGTAFKSFNQWRKEGKRVRKGEKAFLLWGKPRQVAAKEAEENEDFKFFPLAYVFSSEQVENV